MSLDDIQRFRYAKAQFEEGLAQFSGYKMTEEVRELIKDRLMEISERLVEEGIIEVEIPKYEDHFEITVDGNQINIKPKSVWAANMMTLNR